MADWSDVPAPSAGHILFGCVRWTPEVERLPRRGKVCPVCKSHRVSRDRVEGGAIPEGSRFYCAACRRFGLQHLVDRAILLGKSPDRTRQNKGPASGKPSRGGKG